VYDNLHFRTLHQPTIKALITNDSVRCITQSETPFEESHKRAGEVKNYFSIFKYFNLTFKVKYDSEFQLIDLTSRGSFHYLKNEGKHNADNIKLSSALDYLKNFADYFKIDLRHLHLLPLECAQMINIPFEVEDLVRNTFCEERKMFNNNSPGNPSKISGSPSNDYRLKVYGKYAEFPLHCKPNTFRMEYQAKKMRAFQTKVYLELYDSKLENMADLLDIKNWFMIRDIHLERFSQLVIYDSSIILPKNSKYKKELSNFSNHNYWEKLIIDCKYGKVNRLEYNKKVNTLRHLSKTYGNDIHSTIMQLLKKQWDNFLYLANSIQFEIIRIPTHAPILKNTHAPFIECAPCNHFRKIQLKTCPVTGLDISMQKADSNLLSNSGLKYYQNAEPNIFERLKTNLLTGKENRFENDIYHKLSKQIRNRFYNNLDRYSVNQTNLFT
jgi:hypothetical protein